VTDVSFSCRNKAVADGAVSFYIDHCVGVRIATATYGIEYLTSFDENDPEHIARSNKAIFRPSGRMCLCHIEGGSDELTLTYIYSAT